MSPILVRPVREQLEHDRVIRLLQQDLQKRKVEVGINPGFEQNAGVGPGARKEFPDAVVYSLEKGRKVVAVVEVETGESVNHLEAMAQWAHLAKLRVPFHLYVPLGSVDVARRLSADYNIPVTEIWSYHQVGEQFKFSLIHPPAAGRGRGAAAAPRTVSVSTIRVPLPDPDELIRRAASETDLVAAPAETAVPATPAAKPRVVPVKAAKGEKSVSKPEPARPAEKAGRPAVRATAPPAPKPVTRKPVPARESAARTAAKSGRVAPAARVAPRNAKNAKTVKSAGRNSAKARPAAVRPARVTKAAKSAATRPARAGARKPAGRRK